MAAKVNTKFILILFIVLSVVGGTVGAIVLLQIRGSVERHVRAGEELMAAGDWGRARGAFLRALKKEPGNSQYALLAQEALLKMTPDTADEAAELFQNYIGLLSHEAEYHPTDAENHLALLEELIDAARRSQAIPYWNSVRDAAEQMLLRVPESNPKWIYGRFYRGAANFDRRVQKLRSAEELERATEDLRAFVEAVPESGEGWSALIVGQVVHAYDLHVNDKDIGDQLETIRADLATAEEHVTEGTGVLVARLTLAMFEHLLDEDQDETAIRAAAIELAERAAVSDDPFEVQRAADVISRLIWVADLPQPIDLLNAYLQRNPDAYDMRLIQARQLYRMDDLAGASESARAVLDAPPVTVSFLSQLQFELKRLASSMLVNVAHLHWYRAPSEERPALLEETRRNREDLAALSADPATDPLVLEADAKIAFAEADYDRALNVFERLIAQGDANYEVLTHAAICHNLLGNVGLARERLAQASALVPGSVNLLQQKARLEIQMQEYAAARETLDLLFRMAPEDPVGLVLAEEVERRGDLLTGPDDPVLAALQEAQIALSANEYDVAEARLRLARDAHPDDQRLAYALVRLKAIEGDTPGALAFLDEAIAKWPQEQRFQSMRISLENPDQIEALRAMATAAEADEDARTVRLALDLSALATRQQVAARTAEADGRPDDAAEARAIAERARQAAAPHVERAMGIMSDTSDLVRQLFADAVMLEDWEEAERLVELAKETNADQAGGVFMEGQYAWARGRYEEALEDLRAASKQLPYSAVVWRTLAIGHRAVGNNTAAQEAFEQAYRINPNDLMTIRPYVELLVQQNERTRALPILRKAKELAPYDMRIREAWLLLEAEVGDAKAALTRRREIYRTAPQDRANAAALASLLGAGNVTDHLLLDADGQRRYAPDRWSRLSITEQNEILAAERARWRDEADRILAALAANADDDDLELRVLQARVHRARGDIDGGEAILTDWIDTREEQEQRLRGLMELARYQFDANRQEAAARSLEMARSLQGPDSVAVDEMLGEMYYRIADFGRAATAYQRVAEVAPSRAVQMQLAQCYVNMRDFEAARAQFADIEPGGDEFRMTMLEAAIEEGEAIETWGEGRRLLREGDRVAADTAFASAERRFASYRAALERAEQLNPASALPLLWRARTLIGDYHRSRELGDPRGSLLDNALSALARAETIKPGDEDVSLARVQVFQARGESNRSITELERLLERNPDRVEARRLLVSLFLEVGSAEAAIALVEEALARDQGATAWRDLLAGLLITHRDDAAGAAEQYRIVFEQAPSRTRLIKLCGAMLLRKPPQPAEVARLIQGHEEYLQIDPILQAQLGQALDQMGRRDQALEQMARSYRTYKQLIAAGEEPPQAIGQWFLRVGRLFDVEELSLAEDYVRGLCDDAPDVWELRELASFWRAGGRGGADRMIALLREAREKCPPDGGDDLLALRRTILRELGSVLVATGQVEASLEVWEELAELQPRNFEALNNIAYIYSEALGQPDKALAYAERAVEANPDDWAVLDTLGWIFYRLQRYEESESRIRQSIALNEEAVNQLHLAYVLLARGDDRRAARALQRADELNPDPQTRAEIAELSDDIRTRDAAGG